MWTMNDDVTGSIYVILSDPVSSILLYMNATLQEGISALDERETGLDFSQTLAAGFTPEGVMIQVTEKATHLFVTREPSSNTYFSHTPQASVLAVIVDGPSSAMLTAARRGDELYICHSRVVANGDNFSLVTGDALKIEQEPTCLCFQTFGAVTFAFAGAVDGKIRVYHIEDQTISFLFETLVSVDASDDMARVVESLVIVRNRPNGSLRAYLLCGLRGGMLVSFEVDFNADNLIGNGVFFSIYPHMIDFYTGLNQKQTTSIGNTSVRLQSKTTFAFLTCGTEMWRVSYRSDLPSPAYTLCRIWITDQNNVSPMLYPFPGNYGSLICKPACVVSDFYPLLWAH